MSTPCTGTEPANVLSKFVNILDDFAVAVWVGGLNVDCWLGLDPE